MTWITELEAALARFNDKMPPIHHLNPTTGTLCRSTASGRMCEDCRGRTAEDKRSCSCCSKTVSLWCYQCNIHACLDCMRTHHNGHKRFALYSECGPAIGCTLWSPEYEAQVAQEYKLDLIAKATVMPSQPVMMGEAAEPTRTTPKRAAVVDLSASPPKARKPSPRDDAAVDALSAGMHASSLSPSSYLSPQPPKSPDTGDVLKTALVSEYNRWNGEVARLDAAIDDACMNPGPNTDAQVTDLSNQLAAAKAQRDAAVAHVVALQPDRHQLAAPDSPMAVAALHGHCALLEVELAQAAAKLAASEAEMEAAVVDDNFEEMDRLSAAVDEWKAKKAAYEDERDKFFAVMARQSEDVAALLAKQH